MQVVACPDHVWTPPICEAKKSHSYSIYDKPIKMGATYQKNRNIHLVDKDTFKHIVVKWYMKCFMYWNADLKSSKLWSSQLWTQFKQLRIEAWKSQDYNEVWIRDLVIPVRRSNQLSYEATEVGSWSFVSSNEPVKNGCKVIYEMFHILNCGFE